MNTRKEQKPTARRGRARQLMLLAVRVGRQSVTTLAMWALLTVLGYEIARLYVGNEDAESMVEGVKENIILLAALVAGFVATLHLRLQANTRRWQFVSEYLTRFYLDPLWCTYNELIYAYTDEQFKRQNASVAKEVSDAKDRILGTANTNGAEPHRQVQQYRGVSDAQHGRTTGGDPPSPSHKNYHPWLFQFTEEEMRLDALFGYLRIVDYYCAKGLIGVGEVYRQLGTFLLTIESRKVMQEYIEVNDLAWRRYPFKVQMGVDSPMRAAKNLLDCVKAYDLIMRVKRVPSLWQTEDESARDR